MTRPDDEDHVERYRLRDALEEEIAEGRLPPGFRLDETQLSRRFGVSRTPIREALMQLAAAGLVVSRPRRGMAVANLTPSELVEMFEVMAELEGMAGRLAARRWDQDDAARLRETHVACSRAAEAGDADAYYYENEQFHECIYQASRSGFLYEECIRLRRRLRPYRRLQLRVANRIGDSFREHDAIVTSIMARDAVATQQRLHDHVAIQGDRFADLIASLPRLQTQQETTTRRKTR